MKQSYIHFLIVITLFPALLTARADGITAVRVTGLEFKNGIDDTLRQVDTLQETCVINDEVTAEPFSDDFMEFTVLNESPLLISIESVSYKIQRRTSAEGRLRSGRLAPSGTRFITENSEATLTALFLDARNGRKALSGSSSDLEIDGGFRRVSLRILVKDSQGRRFVRRAATTISLGNLNLCATD